MANYKEITESTVIGVPCGVIGGVVGPWAGSYLIVEEVEEASLLEEELQQWIQEMEEGGFFDQPGGWR